MQIVRQHLPIVLTALLTSSVFAAGPSVAQAAYDAVNSDKVDGKHAVGATATPMGRAGKLVATNRSGRLPDNIIAKAPDADLLDGKDAAEFLGTSETAVDAEKLNGLRSVEYLVGQVFTRKGYEAAGVSDGVATLARETVHVARGASVVVRLTGSQSCSHQTEVQQDRRCKVTIRAYNAERDETLVLGKGEVATGIHGFTRLIPLAVDGSSWLPPGFWDIQVDLALDADPSATSSQFYVQDWHLTVERFENR